MKKCRSSLWGEPSYCKPPFYTVYPYDHHWEDSELEYCCSLHLPVLHQYSKDCSYVLEEPMVEEKRKAECPLQKKRKKKKAIKKIYLKIIVFKLNDELLLLPTRIIFFFLLIL